MLKKAISLVLVSNKSLTYRKWYASGLFSPAALLLTFLSIPTYFLERLENRYRASVQSYGAPDRI